MKKEHKFVFGHLELTDNYGVITCNNGEHIDFQEINTIQEVLYPSYGKKTFGLIANRIATYSVNPEAINLLFSYKYLVAGAIVGKSKLAKRNAELENVIVEGAPIHFFSDMPSAINWIEAAVSLGKI